MRVIIFILKLIGKILLIPVWLLLAVVGLCFNVVVNLYSVAKSFINLFLFIILVGIIVCFRSHYMLYLMVVIGEAALIGLLIASTFVLVLITEARDRLGRVILET